MDFEEMVELLCEYPQMRVNHTVHDPEVYDGDCKYTLTINGIIVGSELVSPGFVRDYIRRHVKGIVIKRNERGEEYVNV